MESNLKVTKTESSYRPYDIFNDKLTKSKIDKHLIDINDIISEDDIRNIRVAIPDLGNTHYSSEEDNHKKRAITPWDVLDIEA